MGTYKQFTGNSPTTATLSGPITGTPSSFTASPSVGFPTGGSVPFVMCIDRGKSTEEKILCTVQTSGVFTGLTRGWDGTTQQDHASGATVEHVIDADTMNDVEIHVHTGRDDHTQYSKADGTRAFTGTVTVPSLVSTGTASCTWLTANNLPTNAIVTTAEATSSTTYADLTTVGPSVTVTTRTTAIVRVSGFATSGGNNNPAYMSYAVSGATTIAAADTTAGVGVSLAGTCVIYEGIVTGLTAGSNTFTAKYKTTSGSAAFTRRSITVIPL